MKKRLLSIASLSIISVSILTSFLGCTPEESLPSIQNGASFSISVTDAGYISIDPGNTRTMEDGYKTKFTTDERIGIYTVRNGMVQDDNVCATYNGTKWVFTDESLKYHIDLPLDYYFVYYPYQESMTTSVNATATTAEDFFADLISNWTPDTNQGTPLLYTQQDLMVGNGTLGEKQGDGSYPLNFVMHHQMGLCEIELPVRKYNFTNAPEYFYPAPQLVFNDFAPYGIEVGVYRYLVKPGNMHNLSGSYYNSAQTCAYRFDTTISKAKYKRYVVDNGNTNLISETTHTLAIGDYYLDDGEIIGKDENLTEEQRNRCVGLVFGIEKNSTDTGEYISLNNQPMTTIHGYVVSLINLGLHKWSTIREKCPNLSIDKNDWNGWSNTQVIKNIAKNDNTPDRFAATNVCLSLGTASNHPEYAPSAFSSGWFMPSSGQLSTIAKNTVAILYPQLERLGLEPYIDGDTDIFWPAIGDKHNPGIACWIVKFPSGDCSDWHFPETLHNVLPVLAF